MAPRPGRHRSARCLTRTCIVVPPIQPDDGGSRPHGKQPAATGEPKTRTPVVRSIHATSSGRSTPSDGWTTSPRSSIWATTSILYSAARPSPSTPTPGCSDRSSSNPARDRGTPRSSDCVSSPIFGHVPLAKVERSDISSWVAELIASRRASGDVSISISVDHVYKVLHSILQSAPLDGRLARNSAVDIELTRAKGNAKRFVTHERGRGPCRKGRRPTHRRCSRPLRPAVRFGELAALRVHDIDFRRRRLCVAQSATEVDRGRLRQGLRLAQVLPQRSVPLRPSHLGQLA